MTNNITEIGYKCNMKKCKSTSLEIGRFISELSSKAMSQPTPTIQDKDIDRLGHILDVMDQSCGINDADTKMINKYFNEIRNIYSSARGSRLTPPLSDLLDRIDSANSDCKCH
jgi:hypothetical protein